MLTALVLFPVLILGDQWHNHQIVELRHHEAKAAAAVIVGIVLVVALAWVFVRWPILMPLSILGAVPFRIPLESGGESANLLVPLYVVIAAGVLAAMFLPPPAEKRRPRWVAKTLAIFVVLYALQALYSEDFSKGLQEVCFFLVPFTLAYILLRELPWDRRLLVSALVLGPGGAGRFVVDRKRRVRQPQPLLERGGDPLERIPHLLPGQLDVLGPEHLRPLPRPGAGRRHRGDALGEEPAERLAARRADPGPLAGPRADLQPVELHRPRRRPRRARRAALVVALDRGARPRRDRPRRGRRPLRRRQVAHLRPLQRRHLGARPPDLRGRRTLLRPAALGLRLGLLPDRLREPPGDDQSAGDGLPHRAGHGRRRAGADRPRRLRRPDRRRAVEDGGGAVGARAGPPAHGVRGRPRRGARRLRRAPDPHDGLRRVLPGSDHVGAPGGRRVAGRCAPHRIARR